MDLSNVVIFMGGTRRKAILTGVKMSQRKI